MLNFELPVVFPSTVRGRINFETDCQAQTVRRPRRLPIEFWLPIELWLPIQSTAVLAIRTEEHSSRPQAANDTIGRVVLNGTRHEELFTPRRNER